MKHVWTILVVSVFAFNSRAESEGVRVGPGKAVEEITKDGGFRLSEKAMKTIEVRLRSVAAEVFEIQKSALVFYGVKVGVYRRREGMFRLVSVEVRKKTDDVFTVFSEQLQIGDQIATEGVGLLRVSELDAFGGEQ